MIKKAIFFISPIQTVDFYAAQMTGSQSYKSAEQVTLNRT